MHLHCQDTLFLGSEGCADTVCFPYTAFGSTQHGKVLLNTPWQECAWVAWFCEQGGSVSTCWCLRKGCCLLIRACRQMSCRHGAVFKDLQLTGSGLLVRMHLADAPVQQETCGGPPCSASQARRHELCTSSMGNRQEGRHHQLPPCWGNLGLSASVRGPAQTAKPFMPHQGDSDVEDCNCHYPCFPMVPIMKRWASPPGTLSARPQSALAFSLC